MQTIRLAPCLLALLFAGAASAADVPKRKSGLWEVNTQMTGMPAGMPGQGPMQMCIDQASDDVMSDRNNTRGKADCPVMEIRPGAGKVTVHSVCRHGGTTATTDAVITGDFDKSYRNDMVTRFNPPQNGMKEMKMTQEARWLGPCKPGQKPGDIIMPGGGKMNMEEMMNDPQMREMMKRQQQAR
ncbi:MAG: hypothetical protein CVU34_16960 [Betaproteobacteria bacterium HGW-Betaproteobacteria-7]|nr:MAG: hypothetical protein CVU34_16960 [Betaproteobacteria bacterium HGW-Betaproteobacteria-7]